MIAAGHRHRGGHNHLGHGPVLVAQNHKQRVERHRGNAVAGGEVERHALNGIAWSGYGRFYRIDIRNYQAIVTGLVDGQIDAGAVRADCRRRSCRPLVGAGIPESQNWIVRSGNIEFVLGGYLELRNGGQRFRVQINGKYGRPTQGQGKCNPLRRDDGGLKLNRFGDGSYHRQCGIGINGRRRLRRRQGDGASQGRQTHIQQFAGIPR